MINIRITVDKTHLSKTGTWPVVFELYEETQHIKMQSGFVTKPSDWHGGKDPYDVFKKSYPIKDGNKMIGELHTLMMFRLRKLELEGKTEGKTLAEIRDMLSGKTTTKAPKTLNQKFKEEIKKKSKSTASFYEWTLKVIEEYTNGKDVKFTDLTVSWLESFNLWLEKRGNKINTRSIHLRDIRAVFNAATKTGDANKAESPFADFSVKSIRKEKEFLKIELMRDLIIHRWGEDEESTLILAKDMFLLSFAMCGINLVDLFNLKVSDVQNGIISFQRTKIKFREPELIKIAINPLSEYYIQTHRGHDGYLLCMHERYKDYRNCYHTLQSRIRKLGAEIGEPNMTFYWARYSWATYASHLGIDEAIISRALGHTPKSLAGQTYITFDWNRVTAANVKIVNWVREI